MDTPALALVVQALGIDRSHPDTGVGRIRGVESDEVPRHRSGILVGADLRGFGMMGAMRVRTVRGSPAN